MIGDVILNVDLVRTLFIIGPEPRNHLGGFEFLSDSAVIILLNHISNFRFKLVFCNYNRLVMPNQQ